MSGDWVAEFGCTPLTAHALTRSSHLDNLKLYFHRNFASVSGHGSGAENIMAGIGFDFEITNVFNFHFDWQNVFYDIDSDADVDKINAYTIEFKYDFIK